MHSDSESHFVSCIMPTYNRRGLVAQSIRYFLRQDYEPRELLIIDDGPDAIGDLVLIDPRIRYFRLPAKSSIGAKRNLACEEACGGIILHWDDDDWHAPRRISYQVAFLLEQQADLCGLRIVLFYDWRKHEAWRYDYPRGGRFWVHGNSFCYRRSFWERNRFADVDVGEDIRMLWSAGASRMVGLEDYTVHVSIMHGANISARDAGGKWWTPYPVEQVAELLGPDFSNYTQSCDPALQVGEEASATDRFTIARTTDLARPEFAAFNHGQNLPTMRRWELPRVLFDARLDNSMAVLDCTINPVGMQERLAALYPHVIYRHWNPLPASGLALPFGVPDRAFDRVFCINTIEHLTRPQRELLIAALARKLKPGGRLLLTSDFYFDSSWKQPAFLNAGVMRADGAEFPGGWNKLTAREWVELCAPHGLEPPPGASLADPAEDDLSCYRHPLPLSHATISGSFVKTGAPPVESRHSIVLALLSWNTRAITLDSVRAYLREARMLSRLGHAVSICVCDNGSTDGTAEALRRLESNPEIPLHLILNPRNRGNSVGRNQIIDHVLRSGADYVLFIDGDIEIVPFSSFAMLRYMETSGAVLGCVGADWKGESSVRDRVTPYLYSIAPDQVRDFELFACTQYGLFRQEIFRDGVRFDETCPFDGPGLGFEDNDLAFQMKMRGYRNQYFTSMVYLHRASRSSVGIMRQQGIDPQLLFEQRKRYILSKWSTVPAIQQSLLPELRRVHMEL